MQAVNIPESVELCMEIKAGHELLQSPCLGVIKEMDNQGPYCYSCGARKQGRTYKMVAE